MYIIESIINPSILIDIKCFKINTTDIANKVANKGIANILIKLEISIFIALIHIMLNPIFETKMLKNTTNDAPNIPHLLVNG